MKSNFTFKETGIQDLILVEPFYVPDERGSFTKFYEKNIFKANGISFEPFESFESLSSEGVIRGMHFQTNHPQSKLVRCLVGEIYDVAVDLRKDSPTFGNWEGVYLSAKNRNMLYIPEGFAHGFLTLEDGTITSYLCGNQFDPKSDGGVRWNDSTIGIKWPLDRISKEILISEKDRTLPLLQELNL